MLTPQQIAALDTQESDALADLQTNVIDVNKRARRDGHTRGVSLIGVSTGLEFNMIPYSTIDRIAALLAVAAVKIGDTQLREEGFEG